ncbi:hypothetical protein, partial [Escherichia coli]|uniref:hypothetical protein n=1 Tax=Escherichia coli TaxID=562 RepID=UPI0019D3DD4C
KRAYCLKTQPATGETYPKSDLFNKANTGLQPGKSVGVYHKLHTNENQSDSDGKYRHHDPDIAFHPPY